MSGSLANFSDTTLRFDTLHLSQQAPLFLQKPSLAFGVLPLFSRTTNEKPETWTLYEKLFLSCLQTGDDKSAHLCLERLTDRFESSNDRLMSLRGLYREAVAENDAALTHILNDYEDVLAQDPANSPIAKRRITLLQSLSRPLDAVSAIITLLDISPTDAEAWFELSDIYASLGLYPQAVYSLEEVALIAPNAWKVQARMGELLYLSACSGSTEVAEATLIDAMRRFCRSIELCDGYLRGYYGLKIVTSRLLQSVIQASRTASVSTRDTGTPISSSSRARFQKLNMLATSKLAEIITRVSAGDPGWQGYKESEVIAARQLLDSRNRLTKH